MIDGQGDDRVIAKRAVLLAPGWRAARDQAEALGWPKHWQEGAGGFLSPKCEFVRPAEQAADLAGIRPEETLYLGEWGVQGWGEDVSMAIVAHRRNGGLVADPAPFPSTSSPEMPELAGAPLWYAVHTLPMREIKADAELRRLGYITFLPLSRVKRWRKRPNRNTNVLEVVDLPYLNRYLFLALHSGQSLMRANDAENVSAIVSVAGVPVPLPTRVVDHLMAIADEDCVVLAEDRLPAIRNLRDGDRFRFSEDSVFFGLVGEIENVTRLAKHGEIDVRVEMLRAVRSITVSAEAIGEIEERCRAG